MSENIRTKEDQNLSIHYNYHQPEEKVPGWVESQELLDLPRLPIPLLKTTLARYIETVTPLLSDEELEETKRRVAKFAQYDGPMLDLQLLQLQKQSKTSWLEGFWDSMYLEWRDPIPIHINPCFAFQDDPTPERNGQVVRAALLVSATMWFIDSLRNQIFAPDRERSERLCMHQYTMLFGTMRIPLFARDKLVTSYNSRHIAVVARDQYYWFDVYEDDGRPMEVEELERYLHWILDDARKTEEQITATTSTGDTAHVPPLGMLTTAPRDVWAQSYNTLLKADPRNRDYMEKLSSALFLLCLDQHMPSTLEETGKVLLHTDGRNRWFDKSIQLIVCQNGKAGINMEHSGFDGHTALRYVEDMFNYSVRMRCDSPSSWSAYNQTTSSPVPPSVHKLNFILTPSLKEEIDRATVEFNKLAGECNTAILHYVTYSKVFLVKHKLSPDAFVQMAFQLAYYRLMGSVGSTYESAMTKKFYHGRTECMRSLMNEGITFLKVMTDPSSTALDQRSALCAACTAHTNKVKLAKNGEGVDRHLYGLYNLAKQQQKRLAGYKIPEIFEDVAYARMRYDYMSTSNCGGYALSSFGFGPVVPDGFGIGYILKDKCMHFHITNYDTVKTKRFAQLLERTLAELGELVINGTPVRATTNDGEEKAKL